MCTSRGNSPGKRRIKSIKESGRLREHEWKGEEKQKPDEKI
jgi:hypothetical protein